MTRMTRRVRRPHRSIAALAFAVLALALPAGTAGATVLAESTSLDTGTLAGFSQTNTLASTLTMDSSRSYDGSWSAKASYLGGADNAYSRGVWNVTWNTGDDVWYSAAYYLPTGFKSAMQGEVDLMRWDNWLSHPSDTDWGGVVIWGGDKRARLMRFDMAGDSRTLVGPFDVPEGRWFWLEVHQRFSATDGQALSEMYLDGQLIGRSTAANTYGRTIERVRYGLVADAGHAQVNPLTLWFDRAGISTSQIGPLSSATTSPTPTDPTTTTPTDPTTTTPTDPTTTTTTTTTTPTPTTTTPTDPTTTTTTTDPAPTPTTTTTTSSTSTTTTTTTTTTTSKHGRHKRLLASAAATHRRQAHARRHHRKHHRRKRHAHTTRR